MKIAEPNPCKVVQTFMKIPENYSYKTKITLLQIACSIEHKDGNIARKTGFMHCTLHGVKQKFKDVRILFINATWL